MANQVSPIRTGPSHLPPPRPPLKSHEKAECDAKHEQHRASDAELKADFSSIRAKNAELEKEFHKFESKTEAKSELNYKHGVAALGVIGAVLLIIAPLVFKASSGPAPAAAASVCTDTSTPKPPPVVVVYPPPVAPQPVAPAPQLETQIFTSVALPQATQPQLPVEGVCENPPVYHRTKRVQLHTIVEGETLFKVACDYGVSEEAIIKLNDLTPHTSKLGPYWLRTGKKPLRIPPSL